ncbi:hypothetical protein WN51_05235 [Melipona quadrifasciata]|uniref:Uncharacterized protein n=1 Tax=Melipona quadrifasciata TaxID=166423 RepID=A0A0M8ZSL0_9HYME|nr:hypothetical protein WN51_05235 [Melipona quadrifasciata]
MQRDCHYRMTASLTVSKPSPPAQLREKQQDGGRIVRPRRTPIDLFENHGGIVAKRGGKGTLTQRCRVVRSESGMKTPRNQIN